MGSLRESGRGSRHLCQLTASRAGSEGLRADQWWQSSDVPRLKSPRGRAGPTQGSRGGVGRAGASPGATSSEFRDCRGCSHRPLPEVRSPACCGAGGEPAGKACTGHSLARGTGEPQEPPQVGALRLCSPGGKAERPPVQDIKIIKIRSLQV